MTGIAYWFKLCDTRRELKHTRYWLLGVSVWACVVTVMLVARW
jgi:hypothetical protein